MTQDVTSNELLNLLDRLLSEINSSRESMGRASVPRGGLQRLVDPTKDCEQKTFNGLHEFLQARRNN